MSSPQFFGQKIEIVMTGWHLVVTVGTKFGRYRIFPVGDARDFSGWLDSYVQPVVRGDIETGFPLFYQKKGARHGLAPFRHYKTVLHDNRPAGRLLGFSYSP